jgi:hypothetical protein
MVEPNWKPNTHTENTKINNYLWCILIGSTGEHPRRGSYTRPQLFCCNKIITTKGPLWIFRTDLSDWQEILNLWPRGPENLHMVNMTSIGPSTSDLRRKLKWVEEQLEWILLNLLMLLARFLKLRGNRNWNQVMSFMSKMFCYVLWIALRQKENL